MTEKKQWNGLTKKEQKALKDVADDFIKTLTEKVDSLVFIGDSEHLAELVRQFDIISGWQVIRVLQEKGFGPEITALCDKAGKISLNNSKKSESEK